MLCVLTVADFTKAESAPTENDYYPVTTFDVPEGVVLEAGAVQLMPDGKLAVATRRGEIWMVDQPLGKNGHRCQL